MVENENGRKPLPLPLYLARVITCKDYLERMYTMSTSTTPQQLASRKAGKPKSIPFLGNVDVSAIKPEKVLFDNGKEFIFNSSQVKYSLHIYSDLKLNSKPAAGNVTVEFCEAVAGLIDAKPDSEKFITGMKVCGEWLKLLKPSDVISITDYTRDYKGEELSMTVEGIIMKPKTIPTRRLVSQPVEVTGKQKGGGGRAKSEGFIPNFG